MNTVISLRIKKDIKESATKVAQSAGITLSALINSYLHQVVATRRIELYAPEPMTPKLEGLIAQIESELADGAVSKKFTSAKDFLTDLKK